MTSFRLLKGRHTQFVKSRKGPGKIVRDINEVDEKGVSKFTGFEKTFAAKIVRIDKDGDRYLSPQDGFKDGDEIIESDKDLAKLFGANKFERILENMPVAV